MGRFIFVSFGLLVVFLSLSGTGADQPCPPDWSFFDQSCYQVFNQLKTWEEAERSCMQEAEGAHLASIQSLEESAYVARLASNPPRLSRVWIGLSGTRKLFQGRTWQWTDGSPFGYQSWERGQPNNFLSKKYCVELSRISRYLKWKDQPCWFLRYFVCKFQPQVEGSSG
uniref:C-type lectin 5 n=1 Tax=Agkistrodon contortrix contortrix TaxID=8713 RepID=A0A1W7RK10_AGKCO